MTKLELRKAPATLPMQVRGHDLNIGSIDKEARTGTLVFTTGAAVLRLRYVGWDNAVPFDEILVVSEKALDLSRMNLGVPVLDSHSRWSTFSQIAVVERAWIEKGEVEKISVGRWTPNEISFVTVPADPGAQVRASEAMFPLAIVSQLDHGVRAARMRMAEAVRRFG